jgi:hypothetical protein
VWVRPLTLGTLAGGAATALAFPVGYATVGLVLSLRRPTNPIGWLYAASGLAWALELPLGPWLEQLVRDHWPLPLAAQLAVVAGGFLWAPGVAFGITLPFLLLPGGRLLPTILVGLGIAPRVNDVVVYPAVLCVPVTVAVAVLRYRLWDLDGLVSRTVTYALVTGRLAAGTGSLGVAAATLAAAAAFAPLRRRVQALVDRRFNRRRYDAARTVEAFTARLREQVDLDALRAELPGRGRPDCAADPGVAVAAPTGGHTTNPVTALPPGPFDPQACRL